MLWIVRKVSGFVLDFFHSVVKKGSNASTIQKLVHNGQNLNDPSQIGEHILDFYTSLYADNAQANCSYLEMQNFVSKYIPSLVTEEEIKQVVFDLNGDSFPSPNRFGGSFYQACW